MICNFLACKYIAFLLIKKTFSVDFCDFLKI
jgi:hypothetical protein